MPQAQAVPQDAAAVQVTQPAAAQGAAQDANLERMRAVCVDTLVQARRAAAAQQLSALSQRRGPR